MPCGSSKSSLACLAVQLSASITYLYLVHELLGKSCKMDMTNSLCHLVSGDQLIYPCRKILASWVQSDTYLLLQHFSHMVALVC